MNTKRIALYSAVIASSLSLSSNLHAEGHSSLEERIAKLEGLLEEKNESWVEHITFGGVIEVEGSYTDPDSGDSSSDLVVATVELGADAEITDQLSASVLFLYEEDDTDLEVDVATMTYAHESNGFSFTVGQDY